MIEWILYFIIINSYLYLVKMGKRMSKAVSKDGSFTNFTENVVPFGGLVTCGIHAIAGNSKHGYRALIKGIGYPLIEFTSAVTLG